MKHVRQSRKVLHPIRHLIGSPQPWTWTGTKRFNSTKGKKFRELALHLDGDQFRSFCSAIGFVEVNWAFFESQMDRWVQVAFVTLKFRFNGKEAPTSFNRKSTYLRQAFARLPALSKHKRTAIEMLDKADQLSVTRHDLTHAVITAVEPVDFFKFEMVNRRLQRSGMHTVKDITFDIRGFPQLAKELVDLGAKSVRLTSDLANFL
jgi:hypothetical protein